MLNKKTIECDFCVIGGGMSGMLAAISAAREGLNVVLMHERPVLGGNASSEIRMHICGSHGKDNRETGILEEIELENLYLNPTKSYAVWDTVLYSFVRREKNITLLLNCTCMDASTEKGEYADGRNTVIKSVTGYQMTTQILYEIKAKLFCDSSGDSILAPLCDAAFRIGRESKYEYNEACDREVSDGMTMGMSCLIQGRETLQNIKYTPPEWSTKLTSKNFENREPDIYGDHENFWYLELGGDRNTIEDTENLRDELVALASGTWDYIKNSGNFNADKWDLSFLGFLPGKRESRRMCGEYTVTQRDISDGKVFEDEIAYGGWPLDDHFPGGFYHKGVPNTNFPTPGPYSLPYRALYSKNVVNLYFAGRNISMTHFAMSSIRVMATCGLLGEAVGKAAYVAVKYGLTPHGVYKEKISEVQSLLMDEDAFLPSKKRTVSELCKKADLSVNTEVLRNGEDRAHVIYGSSDKGSFYSAKCGETISYSFEPSMVNAVHIVFDSDLNRTTLPGSRSERCYGTRSNVKLNAPQMPMPATLCKEFMLVGKVNGENVELLKVIDNHKRCYHLKIGKILESLSLKVIDIWGEGEEIPIISFDFN